MGTRVTLPPGCYGTEMAADGTKYTASKPGGTVVMEDHHAAAISKSQHAGIGLLTATRSYRLRTKTGRHCPGCGFSAQGWSLVCPHCGTDTLPDNQEDRP